MIYNIKTDNIETYIKRIGQNIKRLRLEHHLTGEKLAEIMDISYSHIYKLEAGINKPSLETLLKLTAVFECTLDDLVNEPCPKKSPMYSLNMSSNLYELLTKMQPDLYKELVDIIKKTEDLK